VLLSKSGTDQLDTTEFLVTISNKLMDIAGINDSIEILVDDNFFHELNFIVHSYRDPIKNYNIKLYERLLKDTLKYELRYGMSEKIPLPKTNLLRLVNRKEFRLREDWREIEQRFLMFSLPYYVGNDQWLCIASYCNQWGHGEYYGLIVEHKKGKTEIRHVFDAGAS
jgi:hypothetical protein